ncbi:hypothetical protein EWB00_004472 [Schistosoma japonicum]|nr:hypothetical protein EWB00_004472 [Schistosoma japonicum]
MTKKMIKLFRKKVMHAIEENIEAECITHVADENVIDDYVEDDRRNGDEDCEEAFEGADKLNKEVKIRSEGIDGYVVVCDDDDNSANNFIEDSDECDGIIDVNSDNNDNANNNISNNKNSNSNNGNSINVSHSIGSSSISGSHNHIRNLNYLPDVDYVDYYMDEIIRNSCNNTMCESDIKDDNEFLKKVGILLLSILLFIPFCIYYFYSLVNYILF